MIGPAGFMAGPKRIESCDDPRGHFWRAVNDKVSQCARCGECATADDFKAEQAGGDRAG